MSAGDVTALYQSLAPARQRLIARDAAIVADQIALARIPAPTGGEAQRGRWMAERFLAAGLDDVLTDDAGNVVGTRRGNGNGGPVVVCAHLDTVFPADTPLEIEHANGRWTGPGVSDNARGLAIMAALADEFARHQCPRRAIVFAATTGEEGTGDLRGARHLFETAGRGARAAIAIDGAGDERVVTSSLGCRRYRITYRGAGGHSWAAFGLPNAVHAAAGLAVRLTATELSAHPRSTLTVSRIGGGSAVNAIPADGWIDVDMRSTSVTELASLDRRLRTAARDALEYENSRRRPGTDALTVELTSLGHRPAGEVAEGDALVQAALGATRVVGGQPEMAIASTDANIPISLGIPAIAIGGGGRGGDTHTTHEWFENTDGPRGVVRALVLLAAAADLA